METTAEMAHEPVRKATPWHFWAVAAIGLLWNAFGAFDYTMTNIRDEAYLANFPPEMMTMIDAFPTWMTAAWALGVWARSRARC